METPKEFLMRICNNDGESTVYYRPYPYASYTEILTFEKALSMLNADIQEMKHFLSAYGIGTEENAHKAAYHIWEEHIETLTPT